MSLYHYYRSRERFAGMFSRLRGSARKKLLLAEVATEQKNPEQRPLPRTNSGPRTATPEDKRSGNFSRRSQMKLKPICLRCVGTAFESHISQCIPEAKAIVSSVRCVFGQKEFLDWCIKADKQGIVGTFLVDLYRDNQSSTCETIIAVLSGSLKDEKDPLIHAEFIRIFAQIRESVTW